MKNIIVITIILYSSIIIFGCSPTVKLGNITGYVTLDSTPSADITVSTSGSSVTTDANGVYTISGINAGSVTITASKSGYGSQSTTVTVSGGSTTAVPTINISSQSGSVYGTARLYEQTDYSGITVEIVERALSTTTDSSGSYSFSNLDSGSVTLRFTKSGYDYATANAVISKDQNTNISVVTLTLSTGSVTGFAVLNDGSTYSGISVSVSGNQQLSATTSSDGSFTITGIPEGTHALLLSKSGYATRAVNITVQNGQVTDAGTNPIYPEYDLSSVLSGTINSMTYINGYLFIATSQKLYKVSTANLTTYDDSVSVSYNYDSISSAPLFIGTGTANIIIAFYFDTVSNDVKTPVYDEYLNYYTTEVDGPTLAQAAALYNDDYSFVYTNSRITKIDIANGNVVAIYTINESGITSMEYKNNHFYVCNSTTFYKYDDDGFSSAPYSVIVEPLGGGTDLIGIAHDGSSIWLIDRNKKLMKIKDDAG